MSTDRPKSIQLTYKPARARRPIHISLIRAAILAIAIATAIGLALLAAALKGLS